MKSYGIKWNNSNTAFNGFMSIFNKEHDTLPHYIRNVQSALCSDEQIFVKFLIITGLRKGEAVSSFNKIIELYKIGNLGKYYDEDKQLLNHFKYRAEFLRGTKNCFISFVSKKHIREISDCQLINYNALHCRLKRRKIPLRLKELRSYNNSYMRKQGILSEAVDILAGRVPKSVFVRHYLGISISELQAQVLPLQEKLLQELYGNVYTVETKDQASNYCI
jgi:hypothetical protein